MIISLESFRVQIILLNVTTSSDPCGCERIWTKMQAQAVTETGTFFAPTHTQVAHITTQTLVYT